MKFWIKESVKISNYFKRYTITVIFKRDPLMTVDLQNQNWIKHFSTLLIIILKFEINSKLKFKEFLIFVFVVR